MTEKISLANALPSLKDFVSFLNAGEQPILSQEKIKNAVHSLRVLSHDIKCDAKGTASLDDLVGAIGVISLTVSAEVLAGANIIPEVDAQLATALFVNGVVAHCISGSLYLVGHKPMSTVPLSNLPLSTDVLPYFSDKLRDTANWLESTIKINQK